MGEDGVEARLDDVQVACLVVVSACLTSCHDSSQGDKVLQSPVWQHVVQTGTTKALEAWEHAVQLTCEVCVYLNDLVWTSADYNACRTRGRRPVVAAGAASICKQQEQARRT